MNAVTFEFTNAKDRVTAKPKVLVRPVARRSVMCNPERQEEARWATRADELVALFDHDDLPSTSGKFGTFLL